MPKITQYANVEGMPLLGLTAHSGRRLKVEIGVENLKIMPNPNRAKQTIDLSITAEWLAHVHLIYLYGMHASLWSGEALEKDIRWLEEIERNLTGCGYFTPGTIKRRHLIVGTEQWSPYLDFVGDETKASHILNFRMTMIGVARLHDRFMRGMRQGLILGDTLTKDYKWLGNLERWLLGSGYMSVEEVHKRYLIVEVPHWQPEFDKRKEEMD